MPQSLIKIPIHMVFSTYARQPILTDCVQRAEIHRYLAGICNPSLSQFHWQKGYGAFAVDYNAIPAIIRYIDNQQSHHLKLSF